MSNFSEMATQTDVSSSDFSAETVGHAFVSQFYRILHQSPDLVHRFYQDSSAMSRPGPDGTLVTVTAMDVSLSLYVLKFCLKCSVGLVDRMHKQKDVGSGSTRCSILL